MAGDFDNDGIVDLAIGNPHDDAPGRSGSGTVHVLYGQPGGWPAQIDQSAGNLPGPEKVRSARIDGAEGGDTLCYSGASGDIDDDGTVDFIVNEMTGNGPGGTPVNVGNMLVISGTALLDPFSPSLSFSLPGPVEFGSQDINAEATAAISVMIENTSDGAVNITSLGLAGPEMAAFSITSDTGQTNLPAGQSRTVEMVFDPSAVGAHGAALTVTNDVDVHQAGIGLRARGIDTSIDPTIVEFLRFGNDVCLRFTSQAGYVYELRRSTDLIIWATILSGIVGTGGVVPVFDSSPPVGPKQFYQVRGTSVATP